MPRPIRESTLATRTARGKLKVRPNAPLKPFFRLIAPGLHLGYRRLPAGPGTWVVRRRGESGKYSVLNLRTETGALITADDFADANGRDVMTFAQAQDAARAEAGMTAGNLTVTQALTRYFEAKQADGKNTASSEGKARAHIDSPLGAIECERLTSARLEQWHIAIANTPRRHLKTIDPEAALKRRRATANRVLTVLRAALNMAYNKGKISSNKAWRAVKPFSDVEAPRERYLSKAEVPRLINACEGDFRTLVQGALQIGARYGQLTALTVGDFNPDTGTVRLVTRKGRGKPKTYYPILTASAFEFFASLCAGRTSDERIFRKSDQPWREGDQLRLMRLACARAGFVPAFGFHQLRHTWTSHAVMNGMPLLMVAETLGHSGTAMLEKHYAHMSTGHKKTLIDNHAPDFGIVAASNVVALR